MYGAEAARKPGLTHLDEVLETVKTLCLGNPDRILARDRLWGVVPVRLEQTDPLLEQRLLLAKGFALGMPLGDHERSPRQEGRLRKVGGGDRPIELEEKAKAVSIKSKRRMMVMIIRTTPSSTTCRRIAATNAQILDLLPSGC